MMWFRKCQYLNLLTILKKVELSQLTILESTKICSVNDSVTMCVTEEAANNTFNYICSAAPV